MRRGARTHCRQYTAVIGVTALTAIYALSIITRPTISPEVCQAYLTLTSVKGLGEVLHKFVVHTEAWYRPLTFYLTNFIIFHLVDIHNVFMIRVLSVALILLSGLIVISLAKRLFASSLIECTVVFALVVTHPIYFAIAYDGSGIVDPFVNMFLNLFVICYLSLLEDDKPKLRRSLSEKSSESAKVWLALSCCFLLLCAITSQERGVAVYAMAGSLYLFYYWQQIRSFKLPSNTAATAVMVFCCVTFILYGRYVILFKGMWGGKDYRLDFEPTYILPNFVKCIELPFRLFFARMGKVYDVHDEMGFNVLAFPFVVALIGYSIKIVRSDDEQEKNRLTVLSILFLCSLPIPVYCGGNVWHFYTAAMYVSIATGRAVWFWLRSCNPRVQIAALGVVFLWLSVATVRGINQELAPGSGHLQSMTLVSKALSDKTLNNIPYMPQVVYYDTDGFGEFTWAFGGKGNLFKYLYSNPRIVEIALVHGKVLESDLALCKETIGKTVLAFGIEIQDLSWHKIEGQNYCDGAAAK